MGIEGVDYEKLHNDTDLMSSLENTWGSAIATHANVPSSTVDIELSIGSVLVEYSITVPAASSALVQSDLTTAISGGGLESALVTSIENIPGIDSATDGTIGVSNIVTPTVTSGVATESESEEKIGWANRAAVIFAVIMIVLCCCCVGIFFAIVLFCKRAKESRSEQSDL